MTTSTPNKRSFKLNAGELIRVPWDRFRGYLVRCTVPFHVGRVLFCADFVHYVDAPAGHQTMNVYAHSRPGVITVIRDGRKERDPETEPYAAWAERVNQRLPAGT